MMPSLPGEIELDSDVTLQFRTALEVDSKLAHAIQLVCEQCHQVTACYLLDARQPDTGEMVLIIALTVIDEAQHLEAVAQQFQNMLREFTTQAAKTFMMSSSLFIESYAGTEFYSRRAV